MPRFDEEIEVGVLPVKPEDELELDPVFDTEVIEPVEDIKPDEPEEEEPVFEPEPEDEPIYVGCFLDRAERAMTGDWTDGPTMTVALCAQTCKDKVRSKGLGYKSQKAYTLT